MKRSDAPNGNILGKPHDCRAGRAAVNLSVVSKSNLVCGSSRLRVGAIQIGRADGLVDVVLASQVRPFRPRVPNFKRHAAAELALDGQVPALPLLLSAREPFIDIPAPSEPCSAG
jgi:hypothetical protein